MPKITVHSGPSNAAADAELAAQQVVLDEGVSGDDAVTPQDSDDENLDLDGDGEVTGYETWTKAQLVSEAEARGLATSGNKAELVERLEGSGPA